MNFAFQSHFRRVVRIFKGCIKTIRLITCFFAAIIYLFGLVITTSPIIHVESIILNAFVIFFIVAFGNSINDYFDSELDSKAKLNKSIPNQTISKKNLFYFCFTLFLIVLILNLFNGNVILIIFNISCLLLSYLYSWGLKSTPLIGNIIVSLLSGSVIVYSSLVLNAFESRIIIISGLMATFSLGYEVLATVRDYKADKDSNVRTICYYLKPYKTLVLSEIIFAGFITFNIYFGVMGLFTTVYTFLFILFIGLPLSYTYYFSKRLEINARVNFILVRFNVIWYVSLITLFFL